MGNERYKYVSTENMREILATLEKRRAAQTELLESLTETLKIANRQRAETNREIDGVTAVLRQRLRPPMFGGVAVRNTEESRRSEIDGWVSDRWYPVISKLDEDLAKLVPDYSLDQLKEKFGGLRYYTSYPIGTPEPIRLVADGLIRIAESDVDDIERKRLGEESTD